MSMTINAPTANATTYNVAGQTEVQFNFDFDPNLVKVDGTALVVEYDGNAIRLENFFDAQGNAQIETLLTQDGQAFSAPEFLSAILDSEGGSETAEDLETAADAATSGSGAGDYNDDAGSLYAGVDSLGGQGDAYDQVQPLTSEEVPGATLAGGGSEINYQPGGFWAWMKDGDGATYVERRQYKGSDETVEEYVDLVGQNRSYVEYRGTDGVDELHLTDDSVGEQTFGPDGLVITAASGDALLLEDNLSFPDNPDQPRIQDIEIIRAGDGADVVDLSSETMTYGDVTVYGEGGDDFLWTNDGNDTVYGGDGNDNIITGRGNDTLDGGVGNDILKGLEGNDILNGGRGNDKLFGGSGDDVINAGTGEHDVVVLGDGTDTLKIDADSLTNGVDSDPFGSGSTVEVLDFGKDDSLDLDSYFVLEQRQGDVTGDGKSDLALHVGDSATGNNTWIVLSDTSLTDLSADVQQYLLEHVV